MDDDEVSSHIPTDEGVINLLADAFDPDLGKKLVDLLNTRSDCRAAQLGTTARAAVATLVNEAPAYEALVVASSLCSAILSGVINHYVTDERELDEIMREGKRQGGTNGAIRRLN